MKRSQYNLNVFPNFIQQTGHFKITILICIIIHEYTYIVINNLIIFVFKRYFRNSRGRLKEILQ